MNNRVRLARLRGAKAAQKLMGIMEVRARIAETFGQVDVLGVLAELDIHVLFRPLDGLLGAYLRGENPGVLLSTKRPHSVQRFTAAHELGHAVLLHEPSLDSPDVLRRAANNVEGVSVPGFASRLQEIEADSFAGEFLLPTWLIAHHARAQSWSASDLGEPETAYQLSLRCGTSYDATVRGLLRNRIVSAARAELALAKTPKSLKRTIRRSDSWSSPWADTWLLGARDVALPSIPLTTGDLIAVQLEQNAAAGFLQSLAEPSASHLNLLSDWVEVGPVVGAPTLKTHVLRAEEAGRAGLTFRHRRPWEEAQTLSKFTVVIRDREEGLSRANRVRLGMEAD